MSTKQIQGYIGTALIVIVTMAIVNRIPEIRNIVNNVSSG